MHCVIYFYFEVLPKFAGIKEVMMKKILLIAVLCSVVVFTAFAQAEKEVSRYTFTTGIENREPVDEITSFTPVEGTNLYFFAELKNMQDTSAKYIWYKNGESIYEFNTNITTARWRAASSMKAGHFKAGDEVKVEVVDSEGTVMETATITID